MSSLPDAELNRPHYVYRCFDSEGTLLYVGVAVSVEDRMFHHTHLCNSWKQPNGTIRRHMVRWTSEQYATKLAARDAERRAITTEAPLLNRQHNPKRFRKVGTATYGTVQPVHPITAQAFPNLPRLSADSAA